MQPHADTPVIASAAPPSTNVRGRERGRDCTLARRCRGGGGRGQRCTYTHTRACTHTRAEARGVCSAMPWRWMRACARLASTVLPPVRVFGSARKSTNNALLLSPAVAVLLCAACSRVLLMRASVPRWLPAPSLLPPRPMKRRPRARGPRSRGPRKKPRQWRNVPQCPLTHSCRVAMY